MKLRLVSPRLTARDQTMESAPRLITLRGIHIGLLANGKRNSDRMLEAIGAALAEEHGAIVQRVITKAHASLPAEPDVLATFQAEVAVVLTAIGD